MNTKVIRQSAVYLAIPLFAFVACGEDALPPTQTAGAPGTAGTVGMAGSGGGAEPTAGTAPTAGNDFGGAPMGGAAGIAGGTTVAGAPPMAGTGGDAGGAGMGGTPPMAGSGGVAGMPIAGSGGTAGMAGMGGSPGGSGGMPGNLNDVAKALDGHTILMPCMRDTSTRVCIPRQINSGCAAGADPALAGGHTHDQTVTMGGTPGTRYRVTLRVQGMVEAKTYTGGMDQNSSGSQNPADGFYIGGRPNNSANAYNIYLLRTSSPARDYFLNSVGTSSDNRVRHSVFIMDYTATIEVEGGSTVRLVSADPNCSAIKNCAEPDVASVCNAVTYPNLDAAIASDIGSQPYNGQFIGFKVMGVALAQ